MSKIAVTSSINIRARPLRVVAFLPAVGRFRVTAAFLAADDAIHQLLCHMVGRVGLTASRFATKSDREAIRRAETCRRAASVPIL